MFIMFLNLLKIVSVKSVTWFDALECETSPLKMGNKKFQNKNCHVYHKLW